MKCILITGMSGTGKSSVMNALRSSGFAAVDTDYDGWCELSVVGGESEWIWREERMCELLGRPLATSLFVSGCTSNQKKFYPYFDYKILLSAPIEVILERVAGRSTNSYGKSEAEQAEICRNYAYVQPLLKKIADYEIDSTTMSVNEIAGFLSGLAMRASAR